MDFELRIPFHQQATKIGVIGGAAHEGDFNALASCDRCRGRRRSDGR
jgi:hypothetical protein